MTTCSLSVTAIFLADGVCTFKVYEGEALLEVDTVSNVHNWGELFRLLSAHYEGYLTKNNKVTVSHEN